VFGYVMMALTAIIILAPVYWLVISSLSTQASLLKAPPDWIPDRLTFDNYKNILFPDASTSQVSRMFMQTLRNSAIVASAVTLVGLVLGIFAAYAFGRLEFRGRRAGLLVILATQMLPAISLIIPLYLVFNNLGWLDSLGMLVIVYLSFGLPFVVYIMTSFLQSIPRELEEAARVDGCSRVGALFRVIIPLSGPGVAATAIFSFLMAWDEFFFALILTSSYASKTVPVAIAEFTGRHAIDYTAMTTGGVLAAIPPVLIALIFQRYIVQGLTAGAVKG